MTDQDQPLILWASNGATRKVMRNIRLYTPEVFFNIMKYVEDGHNAFVVTPNISEPPARLSRKAIRERFPQFLNTPYAVAAMKDERIGK